MNETEVLVSDFKNAFPGIFNFIVGILAQTKAKLLFQAHYFVGLQDTEDSTWLLYLDPHTTQSFNHEEFDKSIHTRQMCWMKANRIDPSLAVGFKFSNYEEFESWTQVKYPKLRVDFSV